MSYSFRLSYKAESNLQKISNNDKGIARRILKKIDQILKKPLHYDFLKGDLHGARKGKVGYYRIIYDIYEQDQLIVILDIGHRKDIYSNSNVSKIVEIRKLGLY